MDKDGVEVTVRKDEMIGIGTIINVVAIIVGGCIGIFGKKLISKKIQEALVKAVGLSVVFIGISGALAEIMSVENGKISTQGTLMMIISMAIGALIGELLDIEKQFEKFGEWLKKISKSEKDDSFINAFVTASYTVCIGAMAIVGAIQDGMQHDATILITKSLLDFIIVAMMTSTMGKGCIFSAVSVGILQGSVTVLSQFIAPFMTEAVLSNLSMIGSILIFCVGVNLIVPGKFKVANLLPAIFVAMIFGFFI